MPAPVSLSDSSDSRHMELSLSDIGYLFADPPVDAFAGSHTGQSGVDAMLQRMKRDRLSRAAPLRLTLTLPAAQIGAETAASVRRTLDAHAAARIGRHEDELILLRRDMRQSLKVGGLFLAACLLLAGLIDQAAFLPAFARGLLREGLIIAGWVGIWHPLDLILYAWWPSRFRISQLQRLQGAEVQLRAA
jgi:hypothetical protein